MISVYKLLFGDTLNFTLEDPELIGLNVEKYITDKSRPWLVFLHGFGGSTKMWKRQIDQFKENYNLSDALNRDAQVILRVMGDGNADVLPQDIISFEKTEGLSPQDKKCYTVVAVIKNSCQSNRLCHTKVLCR